MRKPRGVQLERRSNSSSSPASYGAGASVIAGFGVRLLGWIYIASAIGGISQAAAFQCPPDHYQYPRGACSSCFTIVNEIRNFDNARVYCSVLGGELTTTENETNFKLLSRYLGGLNESRRLWIGYRYTSSGSKIGLEGSDAPSVVLDDNNFNGSTSGNDDSCIGIQNGKFIVAPCTNELPFICTIVYTGEYVTLYQTQRESLKAKFVEKDLFIEQLTSEKATIQGKLHELQILMKQLLSERTDLASGMRSHQAHSMASSRRRPMILSTSGFPLTPTPPHSPTDIPIHMRPVASPQAVATRRTSLGLGIQNEHEVSSSFSFTRLAIEDDGDEIDGEIHSQGFAEHSFLVESKELERGEGERGGEEEREGERVPMGDDGHVTSVTAKQIMHLIDELEMTTSGLNKHVVPCTCCTGELVVV